MKKNEIKNPLTNGIELVKMEETKQKALVITQKINMKGGDLMKTLFMRAEEVAEELGVSVSFAYKIIREMNKELKKRGCITISGRVDRKFFHEKFYATKLENNKEE